MDSVRDELAILISSLNAEKFRLLVQSYFKERYKTPDVFITDGPYDGGNDLEIRVNDKAIKRNIQITVQKDNIENKLKDDLKKSKQNVKTYSYLNKLDFFYSQKFTKSKSDELKVMAELDFGIDLNIFDSSILSQLSSDFVSIKRSTLELLDIRASNDLIKIDKQTKILFDLLALGSDTSEVKKHFINSFLFTLLYEKPSITIEDIISNISEKLSNITDIKFYRDLLSSLKGKGLIITDDTKKYFSLSVSKTEEIQKIYENALIQETILKDELEAILEHYNLKDEAKEIAAFLHEAYKENYKVDLEELTHNSLSVGQSIRKIYQDLQKFLHGKNLNENQSKMLTNEILDVSKKNQYLNKIGASILFANLYKSNKLEEYLNKRKQHFYLDTQILLRLICFQYNPSDYEDLAFQSVRNLYETIKKFKGKVHLGTSYDYLTEVAGHIQEALKLQRFMSTPIFATLRTSKNVFFNYYIHLKDSGQIDKEFTLNELIDDLLDLDTPFFNSHDFVYTVSTRLKQIFEVLDIEVIYHESYEHFQLIKREYEIALAYSDRRRSSHAIDNDLRMIIYLSDMQRHNDEELGFRNEPFLVTWDKVFYDFRRIITLKYRLQGFGYWYIYSPAKLADRLAVMNFKLNPESIDYNIISLTETNFNLSSNKSSFLDIISGFFNIEDISELKLATKLLELEDQTRNLNERPTFDEVSEEASPLVDVLLELRNHYNRSESSYKFNDLIKLFEEDVFKDPIFKVLQTSVEFYGNQNKNFNPIIYKEFDALIKASKELLQQKRE